MKMQFLHLAPFFDLEGGGWQTSRFGRDHAIEEEVRFGRRFTMSPARPYPN